MVHELISKGEFPNGVDKGLIPLIFWFGNREELGNWWSIILLDIAYKIYTKALQLHVESWKWYIRIKLPSYFLDTF
jgi:hypothetical protein